MNSEARLGVCKQPEPTCTEIDRAIKKVRNALSCLKSATKLAGYEPDTKDICDEIESAAWDVEDLEDAFEYCRSQAEEIRAWGQEWKDVAKALIEEYEPERLKRSEAA